MPGCFSCFGRGKSAFAKSSVKNSTSESATADLTAEELQRGGPVVVELFSSQGCATSPVAELVLSRLGRGDLNLEVPVMVVAFHVDYWDHAGWKDPFGLSQWTVRQKAYVEALGLDTLYTPQVVVGGKAHCVGNDEEALVSTIMAAPRFPGLALKVTFQKRTEDSLQVSLSGVLRNKIDQNGANVMVALYENGLITECKSGENKGKVLPNDFVVRKLEKLCNLKDTPAKKTINGTVEFSLWEGFNSGKCGVAVFLQNGSHQIFGAQSISLPDNL